MGVFYFLLIALVLWGIRINKEGYNEDYIEKTQCNAVKGIFIMVVFMRHVVPYVKKAGYDMQSMLDMFYKLIDWQVGQLLVVMFLFYSGYGVMTSISKKGDEYITGFPRRRILTTFVNFDIAVSLFLIMDFVLGIDVTAEKYFLSRIGWDSVGNSNWYIFVILLCYIFTFFAFRMSRGGGRGILYVFIMLFFVICTLIALKDEWWYSTLFCYPAGMLYFIYKKRFETIVQRSYLGALLSSIMLFGLFHVINMLLYNKIIYAFTYNFESILFAILVVIITMKVKIYNNVLAWLGINLFPLYIYQRIPMVAMREISGGDWLCNHPYMFVIICMITSFILAYFYRFWKISLF